ncbi:MAG: hypothetical protein GWM98_00765 [Nitrospinaceae bacterium]|nr:hypothetical protein [Nitrospinaceae bacterium]NIR53311.1 hypothetical protein [Nitrospinaceae bacterium]NIS83709.1 hypothetical protein [Nitrospinaceae bacterium]NIT80505.1 hypothetical protein [Nitrospinaceae bacterium]NIU42833.1 hypothetical protein [Nitrospinaceae bacterium]
MMKRIFEGCVIAGVLLGMSALTPGPAMAAEPPDSLPEIERIEMSITQGGQRSMTTELIIRKRNGRWITCFVTNYDPKNREEECAFPVDDFKVEHITRVALKKPLEKLDLARLGWTPENLRDRAQQIFDSKVPNHSEFRDKPEPYKRLFRKAFFRMFRDAEEMRAFLKWCLDGYRTYHPNHQRVTLVFKDGRKLDYRSSKSHPGLIPWRVADGQTVRWTFDPEMTHALFALMPDVDLRKRKYPRKHALRLSGMYYRRPAFDPKWMKDPLNMIYEDYWVYYFNGYLKHQATLSFYGQRLAPLMKKYRMVNSKFDRQTDGVMLWEAKLLKKDGPRKIFFDVRQVAHPSPDGSIPRLVRKMDTLAARIEHIPWLREALKDKPDDVAYFHFDLSEAYDEYSHKAHRVKEALEKAGAVDMVRKMREQYEGMVLLKMVHESNDLDDEHAPSKWLLFPDDTLLVYEPSYYGAHFWWQWPTEYGHPRPYLVSVTPDGRRTVLRPPKKKP